MIKPTQAQIEAAAQAIFKQRLERDWGQWNCMDDAKVALTAAAEVGPSETEIEAIQAEAPALEKLENIEAITIERCAQRLEQFYLNPEGKIRDADALDDYIAAIMALKDRP